jgi:hypothetical protein
MISSDAYQSGVAGNVVDATRHCSPKFGNDEILHANRLGQVFRPLFAPGILDVAEEFFFFVSLEIAGWFQVCGFFTRSLLSSR